MPLVVDTDIPLTTGLMAWRLVVDSLSAGICCHATKWPRWASAAISRGRSGRPVRGHQRIMRALRGEWTSGELRTATAEQSLGSAVVLCDSADVSPPWIVRYIDRRALGSRSRTPFNFTVGSTTMALTSPVRTSSRCSAAKASGVTGTDPRGLRRRSHGQASTSVDMIRTDRGSLPSRRQSDLLSTIELTASVHPVGISRRTSPVGSGYRSGPQGEGPRLVVAPRREPT